VKHLFESKKDSEGKVGIACIYLSYKEEDQTIEKLLLSIIKQLIQCRKSISKKVIDTYERCEDGGIRPSKDEIVEMLQCEVDIFVDAYIVVDALDECTHGVRVSLLDELEKIQPKIHLLVTSRRLGIITERLKLSVTLEITAKPEDIRAFISAHIDDPNNYRREELCQKEAKAPDGNRRRHHRQSCRNVSPGSPPH